MSYYDQTFEPWTIVDGQCVVADESEWQKLVGLNEYHADDLRRWNRWADRTGAHDHKDYSPPKSPIVKIATDIFEDVTGPINVAGYQKGFVEGTGGRPLIHEDILTSFFQTIDANPHVDYLLTTQRPELVREKWPQVSSELFVVNVAHSLPGKSIEALEVFRSNVILAIYVETQADIERLVPELLKCHDLCKGLAVVCNPKEKLNFESVRVNIDPEESYGDEWCYRDILSGYDHHPEWGSRESFSEPLIDLIIAEGNEHPIHPDWLRTLRDQCKDANVPFNFAQWGGFIPSSCVPPCPDTGHYLWPWKDKGDETMMLAIDAERSGRLLDGEEHNGQIETPVNQNGGQ